MSWVESITGFAEADVEDVAAQFDIEGEHIVSRRNGRRLRVGRFETPSLAELRARLPELTDAGSTTVREVVADVQALHRDPDNAGALFQVASQFNTLEMPSPSVTPEAGVDGYAHDRTQGPACAIACGAGTLWRNWLAEVDGKRGQTADRQIDTLADLIAATGTSLTMRNGYALPSAEQLAHTVEHVDALAAEERDALAGRLRIGMQWNTEVTLGAPGHEVTQAYCSAVPVAYSSHDAAAWQSVARLVLDAAYDATLTAARINAEATGNRTLYLTLLGGGVFGNPIEWIVDAIRRAVERHAGAGLDIAIVSFRSPQPELADLLA